MSWTPESSFKHHWQGLHQIGKIVEGVNPTPHLSIREMSFGEDLMGLVEVINKVLSGQDEIRRALQEGILTQEDFVVQLRNLSDRISESSRTLQSAVEDIERLKIEPLTGKSCAVSPTNRP
jgi:hypothetical protein